MDVSCVFVSIFHATNYSNWGLTSVESSGVHNPTIHPLSPPYCYPLTLSYETETFSHVKTQEKNHLPPSSLFLSVPVLSIHHHDHPIYRPSTPKSRLRTVCKRRVPFADQYGNDRGGPKCLDLYDMFFLESNSRMSFSGALLGHHPCGQFCE